MSAELRELIEHASRATEVIFNMRGKLSPMWHMVNQNGEHWVVPNPPLPSKDEMVAFMRMYFQQEHVRAYVYIDEAWTVQKSDQAEIDAVVRMAAGPGLSGHPDRKEIVMFSAEDATGSMMGRRAITAKDGKRVLGPLHIDEPKTAEGRLIGLLPQHGTKQ